MIKSISQLVVIDEISICLTLTDLPRTWLMTLRGRTQTHTAMSDAAKDTMKKLGVI